MNLYFGGGGLISNSSTLATSCEELTHWKRLWCWEGLGAGGEEDDRGWDGWMASLTRWMWVWVNSGSCWWTGRPGVLQFMGLQRVGHDWATELNWAHQHWVTVFIGLSGRQEWRGCMFQLSVYLCMYLCTVCMYISISLPNLPSSIKIQLIINSSSLNWKYSCVRKILNKLKNRIIIYQ